ncbi:Nucleotidylyl transferase [Ascodesmis nigricans]|uniref:Nucleotidylyl transferase n=1 Tax=Ascodesmis nigricans TaxID=341454 RepID=A0A4S2N3Q3_9PEZI|nr:Nucleotidylyl transferase [Ascodesmis nigricans]
MTPPPTSHLPHYTRLLSTLTPSHPLRLLTPPSHPAHTLHILDSSFNPPTHAHHHLALHSLLQSSTPPTLLLLLATQNADKSPIPASFPDRLAMMEILGREIKERYSQLSSTRETEVEVLVGVTRYARFVDKAVAVEEVFSSPTGRKPEQVWLVGYDTMERILEPRYYRPGDLGALEGFFGSARVRVMGRVGFGAGEEDVVEKLRRGGLREEGARVEWGERVEVVEGLEEEVSSTNVRRAVRDGREDEVGRLVGRGLLEWVKMRGLYKE